MASPGYRDLIYPWNEVNHQGQVTRRIFAPSGQRIELDDETLRDGLQSPSVQLPSIEDKLAILHYMDGLGIHIADIGLPAAGAAVQADCLRLAQEVAHSRLKIQVACAGRTLVSDIEPIADIMQKTGVPVEAHLFIGSSMIRRYTEDWDLSRLLRHTEEAMSFCHAHGVPAMYVTEDTTRAEPEIIAKLFTTAIECGARRVCVSDTVGYSTPDGILNLIEFVRLVIRETGEDVKIDWHGHDDRGLGLCNALVAAIDARVDRIHGTCLGIGERAGNASIDQIIVNLFLMGFYDNDLSKLAEYCRFVAEVYGVPIPDHYPAVGRDAFRTSTGVHAAAIVKAFEKGDGPELADYVYSSVPAHALGLEQLIEIGPVSGRSNIIHCLKKKGYEATEALVERILQHAKQADHILTDDELERLVASAG